MLVSIVYRRGYDLYCFTFLGIIGYYYPIILFNDVIVGFAIMAVNSETKFIVWCSLLIVYIASVKFPVRAESVARPLNQKEEISGFYFSVFMISLAISMIPFLFSHASFNLAEVDKAALSEDLGYDFRLFETAAMLAFVSAIYIRSLPLTLISFSFSIVQLLFGGRFLLLIDLCFLLFLSPRGNKRINIMLLGAVLLGAFFLVAIKLEYYKLPSISSMYTLAMALLDVNSGALMTANPESSAMAAILIEVVRTDFNIPIIYLVDSLISIVPFLAKLLNIEITGFADYYKGVLFFSEGDSFSSSMFAVAYSLAGVVGVLVLVSLLILSAENSCRQIWGTRSVAFRVSFLAFAMTLAMYSHRSDLIFNITILRSIVFLGFVGYYLTPLIELWFKSKYR